MKEVKKLNIGDKILELRKIHGYSQEDIANKLNVSRQTISKWETNQSLPDSDKIVPLCELFNISTDELLMNNAHIDKVNTKSFTIRDENYKKLILKNKRKFAINLCVSIFLYFISIMWIILSEGLGIQEELGVVGFLGIASIATVIIIYTSIVHSNDKKELEEYKEKNKKIENPSVKAINQILALIVLVIYMIISFATGAWHITWIMWVVYSIAAEIVELLFKLGEKKNE